MERYARDIKGGSYAPTFFTIRIPNDENFEHLFEKGKMSPQAEAYFLHEYIHFLQDLTTIPGLSNICIVVDYMKWATHQGKDGKIKVPLAPTPADGYNLWNNNQMSKARLGQGTLKKVIVKDVIGLELNDEVININGDSHTHLNAKVTLKDINDNDITYLIGEYAISESMAYTIEQMIYPNVLPDPYDCPYRIVQKVCDKYLPDFSNDACRIIALCDACLMYSLPGRIFAMSIDLLKSQNYKTMTAEQVYNFITSNQSLLGTEHSIVKGVTTNDHLEKYTILAAEQLSGYFTTENYDQERKSSILMLFTALEIRKQYPDFFLRIAREGQICDNSALRSVLGELGCPVILNNTNALTTIIGRISLLPAQGSMNDPSCFWVFNQMYKIFKKGELNNNTYKCEMIDWCRDSFAKKQVKDFTSEGDDCLYSPWHRMSDEEFQHCTFGRFWRTIQLSGVEPVRNTDD